MQVIELIRLARTASVIEAWCLGDLVILGNEMLIVVVLRLLHAHIGRLVDRGDGDVAVGHNLEVSGR